jgi:hypothetical protein
MAVTYNAKAAKLGTYQQRNSYAESLLDAAVAEQQSLDSQQRNFKDLVIQEQKNATERKQQEQLFANQQFAKAEQDAQAIYKVDLGSNNTNRNFHDYLFGLKEKVYKIRQGQRDGKISSSEAARAIAELNGAVDNTMTEATAVTVQAESLRKALEIPPGQAGAVSSRTPTGVQQALLGMRTGETKYVRKNGITYGVRENPNDPKNPFVANLTQIAKDSEEGTDAFGVVPDLTEAYKNAYNNVVKPAGKDNVDLVTFQEKKVGSQVATIKFMTPKQREKAINSMINANQFAGVLDDEKRMKYVWADLMGKDNDWMNVEGNTQEEIEANIKKQRDEAARFLAEKALTDNAPVDGVKMIQKTKDFKAPKGPKDKTVKSPRVTVDLEQEIGTKEDTYKEIVDQAPGAVGKPEEVLALASAYYEDDNTGYYTKDQLIEMDVDGAEKLPDGNLIFGLNEEGDGVTRRSGINVNNVEDIIEFLAKADNIGEGARVRLKKKYKPKKSDPTDDEPLNFQDTKKAAQQKKEQEQEEKNREKDIKKAEDKVGQFPTATSKM